MLTSLTLGNFKAFGPPQRIPIKPISLVFGPNSSGKSSFIHSLLLLHQSAMVDGNLDVHCPRISGNSVDLGGFQEYVHRHDPGTSVSWELEFATQALKGRLGELVQRHADRLTISLQVGISQKEKLKPAQQNPPIPPAVELPNEIEARQPLNSAPYVKSYKINLNNKPVMSLSARPRQLMSIDYVDVHYPLINESLRACFSGESRVSGLEDVSDEQLETAVNEMLKLLSARGDLLIPRHVGRKGVEDKEEDLIRPSPEVMFYGGVFSSGRLVGAINEQFVWLLDGLLEASHNAIAHSLGRLDYLGPLRTIPPRHFTTSEAHDANWVSGGAFAWQVIKEDPKLREKVNLWLGHKDRLSTGYRLELRKFFTTEELRPKISAEVYNYDVRSRSFVIHQLKELLANSTLPEPDRLRILAEIATKNADCLPENELANFDGLEERKAILDKASEGLVGSDRLVLIDTNTNTEVSHRDVGIGISQVLPVLVTAYASNHHVIAIEQPEIHVHPKLQAELGDVFIESALDEAGPRNTFILETHSEHLILRILRRIRETTSGSCVDAALASGDESALEKHIPVTPDDVSVFYVHPSPAGACVVELPITPDGDFSERWPGGFFAERFEELP